ncbi:MAG: bifunctional glutamate N-acetyltransferase/amino-acid acetyltransferase ArgJ [Rhizobiaceae bacterium]
MQKMSRLRGRSRKIMGKLGYENSAEMPPIDGIRLATCATGIRYRGRDDLLMIEFAPGSVVAATFTKSGTAGAPVLWCRKALHQGRIRAIVANAGNANVLTGSFGVETVDQEVSAAAVLLECPANEVFVCSTGVIGQPLDASRLTAHFPAMVASADGNSWEAAAAAIMTSDAHAKYRTLEVKLSSGPVRISGIAKGSKMIAPNMATMLAFLGTDAHVSPRFLQACLSEAVDDSFNCITVEGDTSTSDSVIIGATGKAGNPLIDGDTTDSTAFRKGLSELCFALSQGIICDGEGATKLIKINVRGAKTKSDARIFAMAIADSPLVKTAIGGGDANWGRIAMAIGKTNLPFAINELDIAIGGVMMAKAGEAIVGADDDAATEHLRGEQVVLDARVGSGDGHISVWTIDLTDDYVKINGHYRS